MISVTRLDGQAMFLNNDLIESIEPTPDTLITMSNGDKLYVRETPDDVIDRVVAFKRRIFAVAECPSGQVQSAGGSQWQ